MIVTIHQPDFLPWCGFFHRIKKSDLFIILNDVSYEKQDYQNRVRIKTPKGLLWLNVPVKHEKVLIKEKIIDNHHYWQKKIIHSIKTNYSKTKNFSEYWPRIEKLILNKEPFLAEYNTTIIKGLMEIYEIKTKTVLSSQLGITTKKNQRIIDLMKKVGGTVYLSGNGGKEYNNEKLFKKNGLLLLYDDYLEIEYEQLYGKFFGGLSSIDLLFNKGKLGMEMVLSL